jgi:sulfate adenylyltransferase subunit 1
MSTDLHARVCWMHPRALQPGRKYLLKHTTQTVQAIVTGIESRLDIRHASSRNPRPPGSRE